MIFVALIFSFGLLFRAADVSSATKHQMNHVTQRDNKTPVDDITASTNCRRHVHFNNLYQYYSQPNSAIKAKLGKVENQLDDIQKKIESLVALVNSSLSTKLTISKSNETEEKPTLVTPLGTGKKSCADFYKSGQRKSGVYKIKPDSLGSFDVFCDQKTAGGGWTVIQKRLDSSVKFLNRGWKDYKSGFGNLNGEFWLGLDKMHRLTKTKNKLRVDLQDWKGNSAYAEYSLFAVSSEQTKYKLSLGSYSGNAGDSLGYHRGSAFTTKDRDNDNDHGKNCAAVLKGPGWWFNSCVASSLNGFYYRGKHSNSWTGINWEKWKGPNYSAKRAEMKIRPVNF